MRLEELSLSNIRSYEELSLQFQDGITLLSGDIGAGKSTLLLAIEFGLFGLSRSELTGPMLLRHGCDEGWVSVAFSVNKTQYRVQRRLKRSGQGVQQDTGWLETQGQRESLTANEIRARIFDILGYPLQFLGKQKNLLYRYTIYTPQEEMKSILEQPAEQRLETIRRLFGIDAYRTARDNAQGLVRLYKQRSKEKEQLSERIQGQVEDLKEELEELPGLVEKRQALLRNKEEFENNAKETYERLKESEKNLNEVEKQLQSISLKEHARKSLQEDIKRMLEANERLKRQREQTAQSLQAAQEQIKDLPKEEPPTKAIKEELSSLQREEGKMLQILEGEDVIDAGVCPACKQEVTEDHADHVRLLLEKKNAAATTKLKRIRDRIQSIKEKLLAADQQARRYQQRVQLDRQIKDWSSRLVELDEQLPSSQKVLEEKQKRLEALPVEDTKKLLEAKKVMDLKARDDREHHRRAEVAIRDIEGALGRTMQKIETLEKRKSQLEELNKEIEKLKEGIERDVAVQSWVANRFAPFTLTVEQHVLKQVHGTFSGAFSNWFSQLIDDDGLQAKAGFNFTPLLEQHGYEVEVSHLSGGERTSVSLAYRLALVHTIHRLLSHLGTANLMMLDEPTDGFSSAQLERLRDVLHSTGTEQIILVSHESQLEGLVDNIIHVHKSSGTSIVS